MAPSPPVLIAGSDQLDALKSRANLPGDSLSFTDAEPLPALEAILAHRPALVVLERFFAATPRGAALINRIKADPTLAETEIRVLAHDGDYSRVIARSGPAPPDSETEPTPPAPALDWRGTRRAARFAIRDGVELQIDGRPAALIDLSRIGAQIITPRPLRPDQQVRVTLAIDDDVARFSASVVWARFEVPRGRGYYRVGLEFAGADPGTVDTFCARHRRP